MSQRTASRTYVGIQGFPSWEITVPEDCLGSDDAAWCSAEGMPCELVAQTRNHKGYRVRVRFLLDDAAEPYAVQVASVELEDSRHEEAEDGSRNFTGYGDARPTSDVTKALESLRLSQLASAMRQVFVDVTDWDAASGLDEDPVRKRDAAARALDRLALVADVYNNAERYPLKAVMGELGMPKSTAALYVRQAKDRGDIPTHE